MDKRILTATRVMERRMGETLPIESIAASLNLSLHHFHRLFVEETGEAPAAFLRRIRMDAATHRLKWGSEPTAMIAHTLGFRSRPAFIRAFRREFGVPPARYREDYRASMDATATINGHKVTRREVDSFHLLAKRYVGDISRLADYWEDFFSSLPDNTGGNLRKALYIGVLHDDFRVTNPDKVRYDCAITISGGHTDPDGQFSAMGLQLVATQPGLYATIDHRGPVEQVPATYELLLNGWILPKGYAPGIEPVLNVHTVPWHLQDPADCAFTILFPIE